MKSRLNKTPQERKLESILSFSKYLSLSSPTRYQEDVYTGLLFRGVELQRRNLNYIFICLRSKKMDLLSKFKKLEKSIEEKVKLSDEYEVECPKYGEHEFSWASPDLEEKSTQIFNEILYENVRRLFVSLTPVQRKFFRKCIIRVKNGSTLSPKRLSEEMEVTPQRIRNIFDQMRMKLGKIGMVNDRGIIFDIKDLYGYIVKFERGHSMRSSRLQKKCN